MKLFTEAFLDKWEALATKGPELWRNKPASNTKRLVMALNPDLHLQATENYRLRLYLRQVAITGLPMVFLIAVFWLLPLAYLWFKYPFVIHNAKYHKLLIGLLAHEGFYMTPWGMLFLVSVNFMLYLPGFYFWNRRAERLRREPPLPDTSAEAVALDTSVWPPPPKKPAD